MILPFRTILYTLLLAAAVGAQTTINVPPSSQPTTINVPATIVQVTPAPVPVPSTRMAIGTNVDDNTYISGSARWADVTRQMTGWFGAAGGTITQYDANGYPQTTGGTGIARAFTYLYGDYPTGDYTVTWDGLKDALSFTGGKQINGVMPNGPNGFKGTVTFNQGDRCEIQQKGGVTNIHILSPDAVPGRVFREAYLVKLSQYKVCRLMPLQHVNGNGLPPILKTSWAERVRPEQWDQTSWGPALEYQAELCRESGTTPWLCIPYGADDATVAQTAQVFVAFPVVDVESSNEYWNTAPAYQGMQIRNDALAMGVYGSGDPNVAGARRAAELTARVGKIFKATLGASHVKVVFGAQATWDAWAVNGLGWVKPGDVDALAIAPYFLPADSLINPTVPQVLASCDKWIDQFLAPGIAANVKAANNYGGIPVWCYETGQHLLPSVKGPANELQWQGDLTPAEMQKYLADPYRAAQVDPGIGAVYDHLFAVERAGGITLSCHFMLFGGWGKSGYWSIYQTSNATDGPKPQALARAIAAGN